MFLKSHQSIVTKADQGVFGYLASSFKLNDSLNIFFSTSHMLSTAQIDWVAHFLMPVSES